VNYADRSGPIGGAFHDVSKNIQRVGSVILKQSKAVGIVPLSCHFYDHINAHVGNMKTTRRSAGCASIDCRNL